MDRRQFISNSALASASMWVPQLLQSPNLLNATTEKVLVVIQLSGGNDGLNTVVPFSNDLYYRYRPKLGIDRNIVLPINEDIGLHPSLKPLLPIYDQGELLVLNGVGYPNPNRSHFRSMDIWQTGSDADQYIKTGWLGRYLDHDCSGCANPYHALQIGDNLGIALQGENRDGFAMRDGSHLRRLNSNQFINNLVKEQSGRQRRDGNLDYLYKTMIEVQQSADYLIKQSRVIKSQRSYPVHPFGRGTKLISELITAGTNTKIYYISLPGFDTHANQYVRQQKLLSVYAQSVSALVADLREHGLLDNTLIMTFSEFGRRVEENGSRGTDHGTANNMFLMGGALQKKGIYNPLPSLENLDNGDLKYTLDFRNVYASILKDWLEVDPALTLTGSFEPLPLF